MCQLVLPPPAPNVRVRLAHMCARCSPRAHADRHNYDPFVLELDMRSFSANTPKITLQSHM